jgi:predicted Zn-dependent protease
MSRTGRRSECADRLRLLWSAVLLIGLVTATAAQSSAKPDLYFIPIGDVQTGMIDGFTAHFQKKFGIAIKVLSPLGFDRVAFDTARSQMSADRMIQAVRYRHATLVKNPQTRIIAITPYDMYMEAMGDKWRFAFSLRSGDGHVAVVSYARMSLAQRGTAANEELLHVRLRKMIAKNIGIMYFGLPASDNPRSVLFRNILGVEELDAMTEEFDPKP